MGFKNQEAILGCRQTFNLTLAEFHFLWYLAFRGNDDERDFAVRGEAWPGYPVIEAETGLDPDTSRKAAKRLESLKILSIYEPGYKGRKSKTYVVDYAFIESASDRVGEGPINGASETDSTVGEGPTRLPDWVGGGPTVGRRETDETNMEQEGSALKKKKREAKAEAKAPSAAGALASASTLLSEETNQLIDLHKLLKPGETDYDQVQFNTDNPLYTAHVMIWAYRVSNYRSRLNGIKTFIKALPTISASYEKYMAKLSPLKPRPEEAVPTLEGALRYAEESAFITPHEYAAKQMKKRKGQDGPVCERAGCPNATETDAAPAAWGLTHADRPEKFYLCRDCKEALDARAFTPVWDGFRYQMEENYADIDVEDL